MYISEIIIDGFKSYAQKTVVSGFDPQFNAITGLNGSGKSNILDSICFVLGISNLTQVRVGNLQELVYKQGQAGVSKATVTIVFNNQDVATSPVGYESHKQITVTRQVIIGGKNKYMINGHTVQQSQVQNLFHSVQLNVNNPHFLIMQGRITKVLNMKPPETLSMIEEAAGTRMFETKKQAALKTIEKKQLKVEEITKCMAEEIMPTLEKLRDERQSYISWQSNNSELERLERLCVAFDFKAADDKVKGADQQKVAMEKEMQNLDFIQKSKLEEADTCSKRIADIENQLESVTKEELKMLKKDETDVSKDLVRSNTLLTNQKESISNDRDNVLNLKKQLAVAHKSLHAKKSDLMQSNSIIDMKTHEATAAEDNANMLSERYQNACAGKADADDAEVLSLPEQVAIWERKARESQSQLKQSAMKMDHATLTIKDLRKVSASQKKEYENSAKESDGLKEMIKTLSADLHSMQAKGGISDEAELKQRTQALKSELTSLRDVVDNLATNVEARLNFEFRDPVKGFDRSKVKGLVAKLVQVNDPRTSTALEIAAGPKLYQVIVDNEQTGKLLLEKGQLRKRVTILPMNKITSRCTESSKVARAKEIASSMGGNAYLALELVGYEQDVGRAMEYVFGNTIICENSEIAKAVAFDRSIRNKTVTLDGDVYDPAGTMTGGAKSQIGSLLCKLDELHNAQYQLNKKDKEYSEIKRTLENWESHSGLVKDIQNELELKQHTLNLFDQKLKNTTYAQTVTQIESLENDLVTFKTEVGSLEAVHRQANEELLKLKNAEANIKKQREKAMKEIETAMKQAGKVASSLKSELASLRSMRDVIEKEIVSLSNDIRSLEDQIASSDVSSMKSNEELMKFEKEVERLRRKYEDSKAQVKMKEDELQQFNKEVKALYVSIKKAKEESQNAGIKAKTVQHRLKEWEKDCKEASKDKNKLLKDHPWIQREMAYFGVPGSDFDFTGKDVLQSKKRLSEVKVDQEKLAKKINKKLMGMIEKAEAEYDDLSKKKAILLKDKSNIESVINELDIKKTQALQTTWIKVNRDFGAIFSMLLPGTHAKLDPPEGGSVVDGLEVKVAFNGVWKESLTELSGGQRSLLALSLILSLLLFKPAPMYILDEVDAALDLSHTQNIGLMLKTHFSTSQFIVVSLKEGMFNNANVIFRTKFVDGISMVTRTAAGGRAKALALQESAASNVMESLVRDDEADEKASNEKEPSRKKGKNVSGGSAVAKRVVTKEIEI